MGYAYVDGRKCHACKMCQFIARNTSNLRSHVEAKHTNGEAYICEYCHDKKTTWQTFQAHVRRFHSNTDLCESQENQFQY